jgi:hypothetical protein
LTCIRNNQKNSTSMQSRYYNPSLTLPLKKGEGTRTLAPPCQRVGNKNFSSSLPKGREQEL